MISNKIDIYQYIELLNTGFIQNFCIDLDNNKIVPIDSSEPFNRGKDPWEGEDIYYAMLDDIFDYNYFLRDLFCDNSIKKEYNLSNEDSKRLISFFDNKKVFEENKCDSFRITANNFNINSKYWDDLNEILKDILNSDIFNLKNIISPSNYDFKNDGIYYKNTSKKLKLKTLCFYNRGAAWLDSSPEFAIDFDKNRIRGCINKELSQNDISIILDLLIKYNVFKWALNEQWEKTTNSPMSPRFDGIVWGLELIFEDDKILVIDGDNAYPDTYVHLGEEIINKFNTDFLRLKYISCEPEEYELFKKYGDKQLNQK